MVVSLANSAENWDKCFFQNSFEKIHLKILKIHQKNRHASTLKADLGRCECCVNMVDGALNSLWVVVWDSEIKSGCCPSGSFGNDDFANNIQETVFTSISYHEKFQ